MKNILTNKLSLFFIVFVTVLSGCSGPTFVPEKSIYGNKGSINIVYPKEGQLVTAHDSTFILGSLPKTENNYRYRLYINGQKVAVHPDGGFLAFVPVTTGDFTFGMTAYRRDYYYKQFHSDSLRYIKRSKTEPAYPKKISKALTVKIPEPKKTISLDTLVIDGEYFKPAGDLYLVSGDRLEVNFRASTACRAWFSIPGVVDSVPMAESEPGYQPYWGESVFGAGAVPDSLKLGGIYHGFWDIPSVVATDTTRLVYHLAPPPPEEIFNRIWFSPNELKEVNLLKYLTVEDTIEVQQESSYLLSINNPDYPFTVRFTDSVQIIRHEPGKGYFSIFQPQGVEALAVGAVGDWYKLKLSDTQYAWADKKSLEVLPKGILPPKSYLSSIRTYDDDDKLLVEFPLAGKHPFRIIEDDKRTIRIQLFGVISNTDWIRYDFKGDMVDIATWSQPESGLYELRLKLTKDIWGYDTFYKGNTFYFQLNKPPDDVHSLKGKTIVLDPGHASDPGAIGPTGMTEAEANLNIALVLRKKLESKGARVVMTREDDHHVDLYERPVIAKQNDADIFVSIHNNALPDGVNPFVNFGTSSYFYHPHSIDLARAIHGEMIKVTLQPDYGLFHGNLAVNRPTQYPAVLVECAFIIIPEYEALLKTEKFCKNISKGIVKGIEKFLKGYNDGK